MAVILFLLPIIVEFAIGLLGNSGVDYMKCINIATNESIELSQYEITFPEIENNKEVNFDAPSGIKPSENSTSTTSNATTTTQNKTNIFIGDSRFHGMEGSVTSSDEQWVYKDGAGYSWFSSTAIQTLKSKIKSNESYNVIINMEVDDFVNISKYISLYNQMNEDSEYKNCKFIIVSVNPINDTKATNAGQQAKNSSVVEFDEKLKSDINEKITYCDTYSHIKKTFFTTDGIHYIGDTYKILKIIVYKFKRCRIILELNSQKLVVKRFGIKNAIKESSLFFEF